MPSFVNHNRTLTWPPTVYLLDSTHAKPPSSIPTLERCLPDIDEDPYAHFISPITEDDDPYDALSLSAGIVAPDTPPHSSPSSPPLDFEESTSSIPVTTKTSRIRASLTRRWARYVARDHENLHEQYHLHTPAAAAVGASLSPPSSPELEPLLDVDSSDDEASSSPHSTSPGPHKEAYPFKLILREPSSDLALHSVPLPPPDAFERINAAAASAARRQLQLRQWQLRRRRRRYSAYTLSGLRHSWQEPSAELFTVEEGTEDQPQTDSGKPEEEDGVLLGGSEITVIRHDHALTPNFDAESNKGAEADKDAVGIDAEASARTEMETGTEAVEDGAAVESPPSPASSSSSSSSLSSSLYFSFADDGLIAPPTPRQHQLPRRRPLEL